MSETGLLRSVKGDLRFHVRPDTVLVTLKGRVTLSSQKEGTSQVYLKTVNVGTVDVDGL